MSLPRAILFDLDGVLVRSEEIWLRILEEAGQRFRGRPVTREEFAPTFGQGTQADLEVFGFQTTVEELDRFYVERFLHHAHGVWVDPSAAEVLRALRARGVRCGLVTNTVTPLAEAILRATGLEGHLDALSCADQVAHPKPAPDLVEDALRKLGVGAKEAWMVGDSKYDQEAAKAAGVWFVGYRLDGDARVEALRELLPPGEA